MMAPYLGSAFVVNEKPVMNWKFSLDLEWALAEILSPIQPDRCILSDHNVSRCTCYVPDLKSESYRQLAENCEFG